MKEIPLIDVNLLKDHLMIMVGLFLEPLSKHSYKFYSSYGTLRENYASAIVKATKLLENENVRIWDPFCGSGTVLIEAIAEKAGRLVRNKEATTNILFNDSPFLSEVEFLSQEDKKIKGLFIGSDINMRALSSLISNAKEANIEGVDMEYVDLNIDSPLRKTFRLNNGFIAMHGDFEDIGKKVVFKNENKISILTNIPYGKDKRVANESQVASIYSRFGRMIRENKEKLEEVYVLKKSNNKDFEEKSGCEWKSILVFSNAGIKVELVKWNKSNI